MSELGRPLTVLEFCQAAIRLELSRGRAFEIWRQHNPSYSRRAFENRWRVARDLERLFTPFGTIRPGL